MWNLTAWRRRRILRRHGLEPAVWHGAMDQLPLLGRLTLEERQRLAELATLFLHDKSLEAAGGLNLDEDKRLRIALQACLPILELGLDWYDGWVSVIVYPADFVPRYEAVDEAGVVHLIHEPHAGESWDRGPVIINWDDAAQAGEIDGYNVVIHEFAHKLDLLNGVANGMPPLHGDMSPRHWSAAFTAAFEDLHHRLEGGDEPPLDPYAGESPAEFFAVASEGFFERPEALGAAYPQVYEQLKAFYRQDPAAR